MFRYLRTVRLSETDATGVIFFSELLKMAAEAFEVFLESRSFHLHEMITDSEVMIPIVHVESDYLAPIFVGNKLEIHLQLAHLGTSSFTIKATFFNQQTKKEVGKTSIVHVCTSKEKGASVPLVEAMRTILLHLKND